MVNRKGLGQANTFRTNNNTSTGYGVAYADEVSGHRTVGRLADLYALHDWQLSASGDNTNSDAIGQLWYVVNADGNGNGCYYQLKDWSKRNEAAGWSIADYTTKAELQDKIDDIATADEEDITAEGDTPQTQVLKLKDRAYDSLNASGKGYKILRKNWQTINGERKNVLTQEMINEPNTIYEIRYDFDLNGAEIQIKDDCVLNFVGGSLSNGNLVFSNTLIKTNCNNIFFNIVFSGNIINTFFNACWIKCNDIGESINKSSENFRNITVDLGQYTFKTPIKVTNATKLNLDGVFIYDGLLENNLSVILITKSENANIHIGALRLSSAVITTMEYGENRTKNVIGIEFRDSPLNRFYVQKVSNFNEGIRISSIDGRIGCCDNILNVTSLVNNNIGIRLYQQDSPSGKTQFVNDTYIHINYCSGYGDMLTNKLYGIVISGIKFDNESYKLPNITDSYDTCTGVIVEGGDYENVDTFIYCRNAKVSIRNIREEKIKTLIKAIGRISFDYIPKYLNKINSCDFSECYLIEDYKLPPKYKYNIEVDRLTKSINSHDYIYPYNYNMFTSKGINNKGAIYSNFTGLGVIISNFNSNLFFLNSDTDINFCVAVLDENNNNVTTKEILPNNVSMFYSNENLLFSHQDYKGRAFFVVDKSVKKLFIGVGRDTNRKVKFTISTFSTFDIDYNLTYIRGVTRPQALPTNVPFFDESINKNIWCKVINNKIAWVDSSEYDVDLLKIGDSANRPILNNSHTGFQYYDTTLKKYIVWNGTEWTNMDGSSLGEQPTQNENR